MKKVFNNSDQVIHLWANRSQSDARCKNVFFDGPSIYSYGTHYELGRHTNYKGKPIVAINNAGYSVTTVKHIHQAYSATSHLTVVKTKYGFDQAGIFAGLLDEQQNLMFVVSIASTI